MARASINWARGLDELGTGLLRQADIGGRAYEGAMAAEAETRAENRALRAEARALEQRLAAEARQETATIKAELRREEINKRTEGRQEERILEKEGRDAITFTQRLKEEGEARIALLEDELELRQQQWQDQYDLKEEDRVAAAKSSAKIKAAEKRYDKAMSAYESLVKEFGADPSSEGFKYAYRAQQDALQAWNDYASLSGLEMQVNPEIDRLRIHTVRALYAEIMSADLQQDGPFNDFIKALEQGYGPGKEGGKDLDDAMKTINEAIDRLAITLPAEEKSAMLDDLVKAFLANPDVREGTVTVDDDDAVDLGDGDVAPRFRHQAGDPLDRIEEANLEVGAYERAVAAKGRPGKPGARGTEGSEWRDPKWLLPRLEAELRSLITQRDSPGRGAGGKGVRSALTERITRIEALILKMETLIDIADPVVDDTSGGSLEVVPQRGMINAIDQGIPAEALAYWEPDVADARAKAMQGTA